jgi:hypothetical protein
MFSDRHIRKDTGIESDPGIGSDGNRTGLDRLFLAGADDIPWFSGVVDDHHIGRDSHVIFDNDPVTGTDHAPFRDDHIVANEENLLFRSFVFRMEIDARISLDPDMISEMDEAGPVDHHP